LLGPVETPQRLRLGAFGAQWWSEEGTEWQAGLTVLFEQWLSSGHGLAFPESPGSASRDRREVAPSGLLLSAGRLHVLAAEIDSRLAPPGTWRRRLCDWAIAHPESGPQRLIKHRVRRLLGFQRLHFIWQATRSAESPTSRPGSLNSNGTSHELDRFHSASQRHFPVVQRRQGDQRALVRRSRGEICA
jgi:hypothetical protein